MSESAHAEGQRQRQRQGRVTGLLGVLIALTVVGSSAVAVALPVVERELSLDTSGSAWIFAAFALTFSVSTALFGRIADLAGLRGPLVVGVALMAAGSLLAAVAWSFPSLIAGRLVQGVGAGAVPVISNGIIAALFTDADRAKALGRTIAIVSVVSGSGPLVGGAVTQLLGWRWCFALPALGILLVPFIAPAAPATGTRGRVDVRGAALTVAAVSGVILLLQAPTAGAVVAVAGALAAGVAVPLLARHVPRHPDGFLPHAVVGDRRVLLAGLAGATLLAAYIAVLFAVPKLLFANAGLTPIEVGLVLLPAAAVGATLARVTAPRAARADGHFRYAGWAAVAAVAGVLVAAASGGQPALAALGLAGASTGFSVGQAVLVDAVSGWVAPQVRGVALGVYNLLFFTGSAIGSAAIGGLSGLLALPAALAVLAVLPLAGLATTWAGRRAAAGVGVPPAPTAAAGADHGTLAP